MTHGLSAPFADEPSAGKTDLLAGVIEPVARRYDRTHALANFDRPEYWREDCQRTDFVKAPALLRIGVFRPSRRARSLARSRAYAKE